MRVFALLVVAFMTAPLLHAASLTAVEDDSQARDVVVPIPTVAQRWLRDSVVSPDAAPVPNDQVGGSPMSRCDYSPRCPYNENAMRWKRLLRPCQSSCISQGQFSVMYSQGWRCGGC